MRATSRIATAIATTAAAVLIPLTAAPVAAADKGTRPSVQSSQDSGGDSRRSAVPPRGSAKRPLSRVTLPSPYPRTPQARQLPVMPPLSPNAPKWAHKVQQRVDQFIARHPAPGTYWVDVNGNPI